MSNEEYNIDDLLVKVVSGESTEGENQYVLAWISESPANQRYFQDFQKIWTESRHLAIRSTVDEDQAWISFRQRVAGGGQVVTMQTGPKRLGAGRGWLRVAAVFLVVAAGSWFYYLYSYQPAQFLSVSSGARVVLDTLPEGSVVTLNKDRKSVV